MTHNSTAGGMSAPAAAALVGSSLMLGGALSRPYSPDPTHPRLFGWYKRLAKPAITPPDVVFGAAWPLLLSGLGYGAYRLLRRAPSPERNVALGLAAATQALVVLYSKIAFGERNLTGGTRESAALVGVAAAYVVAALRVDPTAAATGAPLALWSCFGAWLTRELAHRNPGLDSGAGS